MRIAEIIIKEQATAGATSAGNISTVVSPHIAIGKDRFKKSFTGSPGKSGKKAPKVPLPKKQKPRSCLCKTLLKIISKQLLLDGQKFDLTN